METKSSKRKFREWFSADELHEESKKWSSELKFARDEQKFLNHMVKDYTLDIIDSDMFKDVQPVVDALNTLEKDLVDLFKKVQLHENQLQIMVDEIDQEKMEEAYLDTHSDLGKEVEDYFVKYRDAKTKMFGMISNVIKRKKQKRLLN
ncbi:hypothetical protein [Flagellimonas oceanensis]|uniref:hypothetical protein n=1 Tax=Flagellimonas oceanensis TaxID=2499163 RepID=UPI000F8E1B6C|nr:hypothetical protein [Allomuricauda oceanensis]|tara:strand:- start:7458 stop:7901 length:444 start_codon:yes stop_codon:yes gene_type:complete